VWPERFGVISRPKGNAVFDTEEECHKDRDARYIIDGDLRRVSRDRMKSHFDRDRRDAAKRTRRSRGDSAN